MKLLKKKTYTTATRALPKGSGTAVAHVPIPNPFSFPLFPHFLLESKVNEKVERFRQTVQETSSVVFCVRCGSTNVQQELLQRLVCGCCGNSINWDGSSFGIACGAGGGPDDAWFEQAAADARQAFSAREQTPPWISAEEAEASATETSQQSQLAQDD